MPLALVGTLLVLIIVGALAVVFFAFWLIKKIL